MVFLLIRLGEPVILSPRTNNLLTNYIHRLLEVLDKGKAAAVTSVVETVDKATGKVIFENQSTVFIRGSGGIGGKKKGSGELSAPDATWTLC